MPTPLPARPSLEWLRKRAKRTLTDLRRLHPAARLADAQRALARAHGFPSWRALHAAVTARGQGDEAIPEALAAGFLRLVGTGDLHAVEALLLERPAFVNVVGPHPFWGGRPQPLHVAIEANRPEMVKLLLRHGADVHGSNDGYLHWSPLLLTYHWGKPGKPAVRAMLLRRGARPGLVEALAAGDDRLALRLLRKGRAALPKEVPNGGSVLMFARTRRAIDRLLQLGVSVEQKDRWGATPMEAFSRMGPRGKPLVRQLLARGIPARPETFARLNDRATLGRLLRETPGLIHDPGILKGAVDFGHRALAEWLLDAGADPNARCGGEADETALHSAAWNGDAKMVELLLARGADPTIRDRQYNGTPAGWAATAVEVTNNPACESLAERLTRAEAGWRPPRV